MKRKYSWNVRLGAAAGLGLLILIMAVAAALVVKNGLLSILIFATVAAVAYSGWLVFSGTQARSRVGWLLLIPLAALLPAEIIVFVSKNNNLRLIAVLSAAAAAYGLLLRLLRNRYWREIEGRVSPGAGHHYKHPVLFINPRSGNGRALKAGVDKIAQHRGIETVLLVPGGNMTALAREAVENGADVLGISGGDGSIGALAKVAVEHDVPLVVLPGGTRCHFAKDLGLEPERIVDALDGFAGLERRVDVGTINGRVFVNNVSFGMYANIISSPEYREHKVRASRGVLQRLLGSKRNLYDLQFSSKRKMYTRAAQVLVGVNRYQTLNVFELGYRERLDEGLLHVLAVTAIDDAMIRRLLAPHRLIGGKGFESNEDFQQWTTNRFVISSTAPRLIAGVDGELETYKTPVTITVQPGALRVLLPVEGAHTRQKKAFDTAVVSRLGEVAAGKPASEANR